MESSNKNESTRSQYPLLGYILLVILTLIWGFNWPMMKMAVTEITPWTFRTYCLVFSGVGMMILAKINGLSLKIPTGEFKPLLLVSFFNITAWQLCSAYGLLYMNAGRASIIAFTMPVWSAILGSTVLKERMTKETLIGLIFGVCGILTLIGPDLKVFGTAPIGALFMLGASITWAAGTMTLKYYKWTMSVFLLTSWQLILGGIPIVVGALIFETSSLLKPISFNCFLAMLYIIVLATIYCYWAWFKIVSIFPTIIASIGVLMIPVLGVFSSSLVLGEPLGLQEVISLILVVSAMVIVMIWPIIRSKAKL